MTQRWRIGITLTAVFITVAVVTIVLINRFQTHFVAEQLSLSDQKERNHFDSLIAKQVDKQLNRLSETTNDLASQEWTFDALTHFEMGISFLSNMSLTPNQHLDVFYQREKSSLFSGTNVSKDQWFSSLDEITKQLQIRYLAAVSYTHLTLPTKA